MGSHGIMQTFLSFKITVQLMAVIELPVDLIASFQRCYEISTHMNAERSVQEPFDWYSIRYFGGDSRVRA